MKKETQNTIIELTEFYSIYFFGSWLYADQPADIDVLIVYDPIACPPSNIQELARPFLDQLKKTFYLEVDAVYLTEKEENDINFIKQERCVSIEKVARANNLFQRIAKSRAR